MTIEEFCDIYEYLTERLNNMPGYELKRNRRNLMLINKFLKASQISSSEELWKFMSFQMILSENRRSGKYCFNLTVNTSSNAIKRWNNRDANQLFLVSKFLRERGYKNPVQNSIKFSEEYLDFLRHKFWNTPKGWLLCVGEYKGALYNQEKCSKCRYEYTCKQI